MRSIAREKDFMISRLSSKEALFTLVVLICFFLAYLHLKIELIEVGYEIADNRGQEKNLIEDNELLQANFLNLKSPQRIEPMALKMGLRYPLQKDLMYINRNQDLKDSNQDIKTAKNENN